MGIYLDDLKRHLRGEDGCVTYPISGHQLGLIGAAAKAEGVESTVALLDEFVTDPKHYSALRTALIQKASIDLVLPTVAAAMQAQPTDEVFMGTLRNVMMDVLRTFERLAHEEHHDPIW